MQECWPRRSLRDLGNLYERYLENMSSNESSPLKTCFEILSQKEHVLAPLLEKKSIGEPCIHEHVPASKITIKSSNVCQITNIFCA